MNSLVNPLLARYHFKNHHYRIFHPKLKEGTCHPESKGGILFVSIRAIRIFPNIPVVGLPVCRPMGETGRQRTASMMW